MPAIEEENTIEFVVEEGGFLPRYSMVGSVGIDIFIPENILLKPQSRRFFDTKVKVAKMPQNNCYLRVAPRSGNAFKQGLGVLGGVIDPDYTGTIMICLYNHSDEPVILKTGDRVAQLIVEMALTPVVKQVAKMPFPRQILKRGERGFGSTGK